MAGGGGVSSEFQYLLMALILVFIVGLLSFIGSSLTTTTVENYDGYLSPVVGFIANGYNFNFTIPIPILPNLDVNFDFNPFSIFGSNVQTFLSEQFLGFALLPPFIAIPLIIIIVFAFGYFIIKIIQGFIP